MQKIKIMRFKRFKLLTALCLSSSLALAQDLFQPDGVYCSTAGPAGLWKFVALPFRISCTVTAGSVVRQIQTQPFLPVGEGYLTADAHLTMPGADGHPITVRIGFFGEYSGDPAFDNSYTLNPAGVPASVPGCYSGMVNSFSTEGAPRSEIDLVKDFNADLPDNQQPVSSVELTAGCESKITSSATTQFRNCKFLSDNTDGLKKSYAGLGALTIASGTNTDGRLLFRQMAQTIRFDGVDVSCQIVPVK